MLGIRCNPFDEINRGWFLITQSFVYHENAIKCYSPCCAPPFANCPLKFEWKNAIAVNDCEKWKCKIVSVKLHCQSCWLTGLPGWNWAQLIVIKSMFRYESAASLKNASVSFRYQTTSINFDLKEIYPFFYPLSSTP